MACKLRSSLLKELMDRDRNALSSALSDLEATKKNNEDLRAQYTAQEAKLLKMQEELESAQENNRNLSAYIPLLRKTVEVKQDEFAQAESSFKEQLEDLRFQNNQLLARNVEYEKQLSDANKLSYDYQESLYVAQTELEHARRDLKKSRTENQTLRMMIEEQQGATSSHDLVENALEPIHNDFYAPVQMQAGAKRRSGHILTNLASANDLLNDSFVEPQTHEDDFDAGNQANQKLSQLVSILKNFETPHFKVLLILAIHLPMPLSQIVSFKINDIFDKKTKSFVSLQHGKKFINLNEMHPVFKRPLTIWFCEKQPSEKFHNAFLFPASKHIKAAGKRKVVQSRHLKGATAWCRIQKVGKTVGFKLDVKWLRDFGELVNNTEVISLFTTEIEDALDDLI
ncbi:hypothetical protein P9112_010489 [Eukaryota sp. TZLM1-RC]